MKRWNTRPETFIGKVSSKRDVITILLLLVLIVWGVECAIYYSSPPHSPRIIGWSSIWEENNGTWVSTWQFVLYDNGTNVKQLIGEHPIWGGV
jgi:hypothetical protein